MEEQKGKASTRAKNKYNAANYDSLRIVVPKGRKQAVEAHAKRKGESCKRSCQRPSEGRYGAYRGRMEESGGNARRIAARRQNPANAPRTHVTYNA